MSQQFEGQSENGNFEEALQLAIATAKEALSTDFVNWTLEKVHGENGGFVLVNILKVVISVQPSAKP
jgi:hypothetical protein